VAVKVDEHLRVHQVAHQLLQPILVLVIPLLLLHFGLTSIVMPRKIWVLQDI
jgi:hypothetical protein